MKPIVEALRSDRTENRIEILNHLINTKACPIEEAPCQEMLTAKTDIETPWVLERKALALRYFHARFQKHL